MKLGLDSYSFHRFFGEITRWETPSETRWSLNDFLNFVSATSLDVVSLETCYLGDPKDFNLEALRKWRKVSGKEVVFTWGHPAGLNGGTDRKAFQDALEFLQVASQLNLPQMRIVLGNHFNF